MDLKLASNEKVEGVRLEIAENGVIVCIETKKEGKKNYDTMWDTKRFAYEFKDSESAISDITSYYRKIMEEHPNYKKYKKSEK